MGTNIRSVGEVAILDLSKQSVGAAEDASVSSEVERLVAGGTRSILINMENVPFVDSAMLGQLLASKKTVLIAGAELKLLRPRKQVYGLLAQSKLENVFGDGEHLAWFDSEDDAMDKIAHWVERDDERARIAAGGHAEVMEHHRYYHRVSRILHWLQSGLPRDEAVETPAALTIETEADSPIRKR